MKTIKPTIEQRLSDAYLQGYDEGSREQAKVFEDITESVSDYHSHNKYGNPNIDWIALGTTIALVGLVIGVLVAIISSNQSYQF